ncbi:hypothetical protein SAMN04487911_14717 [Arenibacter nanhaiticus]|uniref:Uncharacterized protein n=1 Tax=Arenibacter nanhaiticus TaxID=558155 RepID=A0A1M6MTB4_9FLAO|nr:hypothetical protein [Arenibacter nanhaiticus]SHJ86721.1 hypothetical protein SAMN04487911_14717 [Arenibacter nanhaiticus]
MKTTLTILLSFISLSLTAQKNIYESDKFDFLTKDHKTLAIIPFLTHLDLKESLSDSEKLALEMKEGYAVQNALETYFSRIKKKRKFSVEFQNIKNTNAILAQNNISYENIDVYTVKELSLLLGVDGIISGSMDLNILLSDGVPNDFSLLDYIIGDSNYGRIGIKVSDGNSGKLLWKYEKQINRKSGTNTIDLIDLMMKQASRKFPYDKERPRAKNKD